MGKIIIRTHDEEWPEQILSRIEEAIEPEVVKFDTTNKEYLITIEVTELP